MQYKNNIYQCILSSHKWAWPQLTTVGRMSAELATQMASFDILSVCLSNANITHETNKYPRNLSNATVFVHASWPWWFPQKNIGLIDKWVPSPPKKKKLYSKETKKHPMAKQEMSSLPEALCSVLPGSRTGLGAHRPGTHYMTPEIQVRSRITFLR